MRSISDWSVGTGNYTETSIYEGYIEAIKGARKYIYIENQFFISSLASDSVKNQLAQCILDKIISAIENKREFKVIIVLPQHPEGMYYRESVTTRYIMQLQYNTISRGGKSMLEQLKEKYPDININNYLGFYTLRNYDKINNYFVTEQIYVHAKILLIDDRIAIIGSANTNDRSMLGNRDSEIAIKVYSGENIPTKMNNLPWKATKFVHSLRISLWKEHLGMLDSDDSNFIDPISCIDSLWRPIAKQNADIYDLQFPRITYSNDNIPIDNLKIHEIEIKLLDTPAVNNALQQIQGHVTEYVYLFLYLLFFIYFCNFPSFDLHYCRGQNLDLEGIDNLMEDDIFT